MKKRRTAEWRPRDAAEEKDLDATVYFLAFMKLWRAGGRGEKKPRVC